MTDCQHRYRQGFGPAQRSKLHAGTCGHQAQRQRRRADAADRGLQPDWQREAQQVGRQSRCSANDKGVAHQLAQETALGMAYHGPHRRHVKQRHTHADQHRNQQQTLRAR